VRQTSWQILLCTLLGLCGCAGENLSPVNPVGVDLGGAWIVDFGESGTVADLGPRGSVDLRPGSRMTRQKVIRMATGSDLEFVSADFQVLKADKLDIELSRESMGIRYFPGVYRDVTWGERERGLWTVNAGWDEQRLLIISKASGLRVVETLQLTQPNQLTVQVDIKFDGGERQLTRVYNRLPR